MSEWEWDVEVCAGYTCIDGGEMACLVLQSKDGRVVLTEIPLVCLDELKDTKAIRKVLRVLEKFVKDEGKRLKLLERTIELKK